VQKNDYFYFSKGHRQDIKSMKKMNHTRLQLLWKKICEKQVPLLQQLYKQFLSKHLFATCRFNLKWNDQHI